MYEGGRALEICDPSIDLFHGYELRLEASSIQLYSTVRMHLLALAAGCCRLLLY